MSRFRRYKYATSLPTWSPLMPRPPPPRNPSSKVNDCHEYSSFRQDPVSSRGHTVKEPTPRHIPTGFGGHVQPIPGILSRKAEKEQLFTENQQKLPSRPRLPPLLKPLAAKEGQMRPIATKIPAISEKSKKGQLFGEVKEDVLSGILETLNFNGNQAISPLR
ncbi:hypothetical protein DNTS_027258 [Danionella cerebrum]|uniref:Uncharacterized protein n=1 Tax=Danionella cerebrum TaxID=2873325 RepID=A0A553RHU7_9TELE|nr:hypothetical protein DNTS_027258 [Danionella translucida]